MLCQTFFDYAEPYTTEQKKEKKNSWKSRKGLNIVEKYLVEQKKTFNIDEQCLAKAEKCSAEKKN